ncbi:MAG: hypothetical protein A3B70_05510 [Deltaproteobacteria bacterium RIFCSPHIGHO2_02_FULL_40_11]|nr:MAG: hypothetical protein A3B70_05510 [Deltaproteobacteria bacterium RIFCSPHIGHO2_02_FULL_40_11]
MKKYIIIGFVFILGAAASFAYLYQKQDLNHVGADTNSKVWTENSPLIHPKEATDLDIFAKISEQLTPAVVNIHTTQTVRALSPFRGFEDDEFFRRFFDDFFGQQMPKKREREQKQKNLGSGFVISTDGYIITNNHVIQGAEEINVKFAEEAKDEYKAKVIGSDPRTDIALLKIDTKDKKLKIAPLGDSAQIRVGEWVVAIGHPFGYGHTVTHGIVSAKERLFGEGITHPYNDYIQTDASINLGNSGGPLINTKGEVIGINVATDARAQGIIGFAIPINVAKALIPQFVESGHAIRGFIGIQWHELTDDLRKNLNLKKDQEGVIVAEIIKGEPADLSGLKVYDVIIEFNGKSVKNPRELLKEVAKAKVGKPSTVKIIRNGKELSLQLTPIERKDEAEERKKEKDKEDGKEKKGKVDLGIEIADLNKYPGFQEKIDVNEGVVIVQINSDSIAEKAGFEKGDVVIEVNRQKIRNTKDFLKVADELKKGKSYLFRVYRDGAYQLLIVKIE